MSINAMREQNDYALPPLLESEVSADPIEQFGRWFDQARESGGEVPNAMTLATCSADGVPTARIVLLKDFDADGFVFFTNYNSDKADDLAQNPQATLLFYWEKLSRTVRIYGTVDKVSREETEAYFPTRPRGSQLGAWASEQSKVIASREVLHERYAELEKQYEGKDIPIPPHWGGYRVSPTAVEFWQGQSSRLHDRLRYNLEESGWVLRRLSP